MKKIIETGAGVLAGVGALNWGSSKLLSFDVLKFVPSGIWTTLAVLAIAASGAVVLYMVYEKKI